MKYIGEFRNLDDKLYTVYIITNKSETVSQEIVLSDEPFSTEMDTSDDNIYKPVKYQAATVGVVTRNESDYMFNVYSGEANGTDIRLYDENNNLVWGGFATPVVYNNGYTSVHENLEIEAIDGLSILQYYKYHTDNKEIRSFAEILTKLLVRCEVYDEFYVSASLKKTSNDTMPLLNQLYISEQNFFDKKDDKETDDDVAWTCQQVLEEMCQYLGLVCVGNGNKVYFIDYDAIRNGNHSFWKYQVGSTTATKVTLQENISINGDLYRGTGSNLSLDNVYNKVSVKDDFYTFDDIIPDIYDTAYNITKSSDTDLQASQNINNGIFGEVVQGVQGNGNTDPNNNMICMVDRVYDPENEEFTDCNAVFVKYFNHPYYKFYGYNGTNPSSLNYTDTKNMHGAVIAKFFVKKLNETYFTSWWDLIHGHTPTEATLDMWMAKNQISKIKFDNYVMLVNSPDNHIQNGNMLSYPYFETKTADTTALFGGKNAYLVITGSYIWHYMDNDPYPIPTDEIDISEGRYAMRAGQTYLRAKLQWGNKYWNGSNWTTTDSTFQIPYMRDDSSDDSRRADSTMFEPLDFVNTVSWRIGIDESGYLIPLPEGAVMSGLPKFTMYKPFDPDYFSTKSGEGYGQWYWHNVVFLKNFGIKAVIGDPSYSDVNDSDTVYTNIINEHHAQDLDEITCKICTNDGKKPNYSSVGFSSDGGNTFEFLDKIYNGNIDTAGVYDNTGALANGYLRPEEWIVHRLTNQYTDPKVRLELELNSAFAPYSLMTDKWLAGKTFIVDAQSTNYATGQTTVTLVEKA